jgi:hypothetical protein
MLLPWLIGQGFESLGPGTATGLIFASLLMLGIMLWLILGHQPALSPKEAQQ